MQISWTIIEKSQGSLKVSVEGELWTNAQTKAFNKLAKDVVVPGFRKGNAPKDMVRKQISEQNILLEAVESLAQEALNVGLKQENLNPISRPELGIDAITKEAVSMSFTFWVRPEVTLGEYKGLDIKKAKTKVTKKEVDAKIEELRGQFAELVLKEEGHIEHKDTAVIDFEGFKEGVAFEGGKGENYALEIGSNSFIPGFEEALIGMKSGEEKDVALKFPENYQAENLAGQDVVFKVKINEIKAKHLPELTDDFAKEVNHHDTKTLADMREHLEEDLQKEKETKAEEDFNNAILSAVVDGSSVDVPDVMVEEETETMVEDFKNRLQQQGFSMDQYAQITGQTLDDLKAQMRVDAGGKVKVRLVLDAIASKEAFEIKAEEVDAEYAKIAETYSMDIERVKSLAPIDTITYDLRLRKAYDFIRESVKQ